MELEEREGVDPVIERRCAECGTRLTDQEIKAALETNGPFLCTVHANEEVSVEEDAAGKTPSPSVGILRLPGPIRFARMAGSSIAAPGAIAWVTDFLNAAYYARADDERDVDDLRLATASSALAGRSASAAGSACATCSP